MKILSVLLVGIILGACSSPKETTATKKVSTPRITKTDEFKGGTSFENAVIIKVNTESAGVAEEYKWLSQSYPGYSTIRKSQASRGNRHYDIITFKTKEGVEKNAYFDITSFHKK
ncbi:MAG: hypothetical protein E6H09_11530 [Bacteroidetes bacterium]|nr:MAG: hypothetical protein E6H09_11530 [Bacteroidota bacterium]